MEPDFRLRRQHGQVHLHLAGSSAAAAARTRLGSGDHVEISLNGASWTRSLHLTSTPGRSIDWELHYGEFARLSVRSQSSESRLS